MKGDKSVISRTMLKEVDPKVIKRIIRDSDFAYDDELAKHLKWFIRKFDFNVKKNELRHYGTSVIIPAAFDPPFHF